MSKSETLNITKNNKKIGELKILKGSLGPDVADIRNLYEQTGFFTYDPSYGATSSCESSITFIDGDKGILLHRGYPIEQLAEKSSFLELAYLLLNGELPSKSQFSDFSSNIINHTMVHEQILNFYQGFRRDAHPMAILCAATGAMSAFYNDSADINDPEQRRIATNRLIAKIPTLAAMAYKYSVGQPFNYPDNSLSYAENFLQMCFSVPAQKYKSQKILSDAIEKIFILHADHEQNASTSTVRLAGSSGANPFACISAGIASLWGPAHGGANEAVLKMLSEIENEKNISNYLNKARDKGDLSENAEYDAAKEAQGMLELEISKLEETLSNARIIDESKLDSSKVLVHSTVKIKNLLNSATMQYKLVAQSEANLAQGKISVDSPIGKGLLGKQTGDIAEISIPSGNVKFEILDISR